MSKTVLITGASGFIGSHLVKRCLKDGYRVKALVRKGNSCIEPLRTSGVEVVTGDVRDADAVDTAVQGCDLVLHAAALTSDWGPMQDFIDINVGGTRNVCESSLRHGVGRLVHISSFECFDHHLLGRIDEETPCMPRRQSYPDTKIGGSNEVWAAMKRGLSASILYPVWVYGPGDRTLFPLLADSIRKRQMFYWSRNSPISLVYIDNLVELILLAATRPEADGEAFMACDGEPITFEEVCQRVAKAIGSPSPSLYLPFGLVRNLAWMMETAYRIFGSETRPLLTRQAVDVLASRALADVSKSRKMLGWQSLVPQDEGIRRTLDWLVTVDPSLWKMK
ncbi:NAD-dependent epimerase/dehydratase [Chlorobaculum parvum NCIB 8327]|uniref:NAD-dependent epimerase/dehydratase n=1 Tax=Chlorobaculum parvum (strain DSM 263 / NCIMB 8327) TaxID=517417 RepID=B3QM63_CHLP8|nr:SDR family NAD(P)-dependent oxidoreductase [Chlorobaculum parvum]ACF11016.1 NAD-dependent epimerase/dehydratase [Chlorobaculum parvum NCIB 8327]